MTENESVDKYSVLFMGLVTSFQQNALIALGKILNPGTQKTELDLPTAAAFIDMLDMLLAKTRGNLDHDEATVLEQIISHLKLNYVEELNKPKAGETSSRDGETATEESQTEEKPPESE